MKFLLLYHNKYHRDGNNLPLFGHSSSFMSPYMNPGVKCSNTNMDSKPQPNVRIDGLRY